MYKYSVTEKCLISRKFQGDHFHQLNFPFFPFSPHRHGSGMMIKVSQLPVGEFHHPIWSISSSGISLTRKHESCRSRANINYMLDIQPPSKVTPGML